jgi:hypothetical protein
MRHARAARPLKETLIMRNLGLALTAFAIIAAFGWAAEAQSRRAPAGPGYGYVTAESRYGGATVTAPVRQGPKGRLEVRLPGGTWLECGRSCSDTLRRETVDFWKERGHPRAGGDGPGYLQFRF